MEYGTTIFLRRPYAYNTKENILIQPKALVLCGDGINCEEETSFALKLSGFNTTLIHTSQLLKEPQSLKQCQLLVLPGGFSFGDEIASGKVLAIKLKEHLQSVLHEFIDRGSLLLAICNGFQVVVQLGLLPEASGTSVMKASLMQNKWLKFINRWVRLDVSDSSPCQFLSGLKTIELPMRHGEGRLFIDPLNAETIKKQACLRYSEDVNGSLDRIAGLTNSKGNVLGLMPHPEAFVRWTQHPAWTARKTVLARGQSQDTKAEAIPCKLEREPAREPDGLVIFRNAATAICKG